MQAISIFEIFKIGIGPSSSHTLGPWNAARDFRTSIGAGCDHIQVHLYGSLCKTGKGHATDVAVQLGLQGYDSSIIDVDKITTYLKRIADTKVIKIGDAEVSFDPESDIVFKKVTHALHPNTLIFHAYKNGEHMKESIYLSIGGGFIEKPGEPKSKNEVKLPFPIDKGKDILTYTDKYKSSISDIVIQNEKIQRTQEEIVRDLDEILDTMLACIYRGCTTDGILPGGLNVKRRARHLCLQLNGGKSYNSLNEWLETIRNGPRDHSIINRWISCFALAVNEENAAMGRVVTSPTNGAAGVIPAVIMYYFLFCDYKGRDTLINFMCTAGEIGSLFKKGATISAAVGGCQAEIGVSSAMAAGGLTEVLGGTPRQVLMAAEIAMEHHLGMTCDPIGGLVQIPCIERNAMGAVKAITATHLALTSEPHDAKVDIDTVIKTMWDTAQEMNSKYKETAEGGLAYNLPVIMPEC